MTDTGMVAPTKAGNVKISGKYGWVFEVIKGLVDLQWDFSRVSEVTGVPVEKIASLVNDDITLKNAYFSFSPERQEVFKALWEYTDFDGFVYFILSEDTHNVKIGYSSDPFERVKRLQTGSPENLQLIQFIEGNTKVERLLHSRFDSQNVRGEWFRYSGEVKEYVESLPPVI